MIGCQVMGPGENPRRAGSLRDAGAQGHRRGLRAPCASRGTWFAGRVDV
jgi:hypothetical protein